jgi:hypothetical protein
MTIAEKSFDPAAACPLDGVRGVDMSRQLIQSAK